MSRPSLPFHIRSQTYSSLTSSLVGRNRFGQECEGPAQGDVGLCDPEHPLLEILFGHQSHQQVEPRRGLLLGSTPGIPSTKQWLPLPARGPWSSLGSKATHFSWRKRQRTCRLQGRSWRRTWALRVLLCWRKPWDSRPVVTAMAL